MGGRKVLGEGTVPGREGTKVLRGFGERERFRSGEKVPGKIPFLGEPAPRRALVLLAVPNFHHFL